jgi:hypothetical protein
MLTLLLQYETIVADLTSQADFYEAEPLANALAVLNQRIWEIKNVFADELAKDYAELEASKARHPSNFTK